MIALSEWPEWENSKMKNGFQASRYSGCIGRPKIVISLQASITLANSKAPKIAFMATRLLPNSSYESRKRICERGG